MPGAARQREVTLLTNENWWFENHPGCYGDATDNRWTDNVAASGDERMIRTTFNPLVQWAFVHVQARASQHLEPAEAARCLELAKKAADYARRQGNDHRTLFLSAELRGNLELLAAGDRTIDRDALGKLALELMERQACQATDAFARWILYRGQCNADGFRSIAFSAEPGA